MSSKPKELYRSRSKRMIAGVCGGLGEYFNLDPTIFRIVFTLGTLFGMGSLLLVYIVLLVIIPEEPLGVYSSGVYPVVETPVEPPAETVVETSEPEPPAAL